VGSAKGGLSDGRTNGAEIRQAMKEWCHAKQVRGVVGSTVKNQRRFGGKMRPNAQTLGVSKRCSHSYIFAVYGICEHERQTVAANAAPVFAVFEQNRATVSVA
jgi:Glu-tRNA(Gln) amidotransferase subunit E-like FAD-binding protein